MSSPLSPPPEELNPIRLSADPVERRGSKRLSPMKSSTTRPRYCCKISALRAWSRRPAPVRSQPKKREQGSFAVPSLSLSLSLFSFLSFLLRFSFTNLERSAKLNRPPLERELATWKLVYENISRHDVYEAQKRVRGWTKLDRPRVYSVRECVERFFSSPFFYFISLIFEIFLSNDS